MKRIILESVSWVWQGLLRFDVVRSQVCNGEMFSGIKAYWMFRDKERSVITDLRFLTGLRRVILTV